MQGNLIGTNANGDAALGNASYGIRIIGAANNTVGGTTTAARNIISGNARGLSIETVAATGNLVQGNYIGLNPAGTGTLPNNGSGVEVSGVNNLIGGTASGAGNVISGNANDGVTVTGSNSMGNKIQGNLIGTNATGTAALGNTFEGVRVIDAPKTLIGGTTAAARNIISGNSRGISIESAATGSLVQGNYIGTDSTGSNGLGNSQEGVMLLSCSNNLIGGTIRGARNVISGNANDGVRIGGPNATMNLVQGNYIGTKADGVTLLPNLGAGVDVFGAFNNTFGGTAATAGNVIAGNGYAGALIQSGSGNALLGNSFFNNARLAIDLDRNDIIGLLANDQGDPDPGANKHQNYPLLTSVIVSGGNTSILGKLNSTPNKQFRVEFFANSACSNAGFGEGQVFLGTTSVTTDANGDAALNTTLPVAPAGQFITATATSPDNDTSEFSPCALVGGPNPGVLQFVSNFFINSESDGTAKITVTRSSGLLGTVSVHYATSDGVATAPADYATTSGDLTFADGEVIKTFTVPVVDDGVPESQETLNLTLSAPTGGAALGANGAAQLYINDADPNYPGTSFSDASVVEGNSGTVNAVFHITVTTHAAVVTVGYTTTDGTAQAGTDYQATSGTLTFNPGETSKDVNVPVIGDTLAEGNEVFFLNSTGLSAGFVNRAPGEAVIIDDEGSAALSLGAATYSVNENGGSVDVLVKRVGSSTPVTVDYATMDGSAVAGSDYTTKTGTLSFAANETDKTVNIPVLNDAQNEPDETFSFKLSNPVNVVLGSPNVAVITIQDDDAAAPPPANGAVLISEFRFRGPVPANAQTDGHLDEFVELYNTTNAALVVSTDDNSAGWALVAHNGGALPVIFTIPNGTTIPARGHFLAANANGYSLTVAAVGDSTYQPDIFDGTGIALFRTAAPANFDSAHRLDAVGCDNNADPVPALFREGPGLSFTGNSGGEFSFVRKLTTGLPQDTDDNAQDFAFVATDGGTYNGLQAQLGVPAPENLSSPIQRNATIKASVIEPQQVVTAAPNRVRDLTPVPNGAQGTLELRRRFKNSTGAPLTQLRFRVVDITTLNTPNAGGAQADLRLLSSADLGGVQTSGGVLTLRGTLLEASPAQPNGGGLNAAAIINLPGQLAVGASVDVRFVIGVQTGGSFRFFVNVEALTNEATTAKEGGPKLGVPLSR